MLKIVIDTVVFVRSLINPHSQCGKIVFFHSQAYQLFISEAIVTEILEVLRRPELTVKFHTLENMDFSEIIDLLGQAQAVKIPEILYISRDPKDNKFLATAVASGADYIVSEDEDLLDLKEYRGVKIIKAGTFLQILEKSKKE